MEDEGTYISIFYGFLISINTFKTGPASKKRRISASGSNNPDLVDAPPSELDDHALIHDGTSLYIQKLCPIHNMHVGPFKRDSTTVMRRLQIKKMYDALNDDQKVPIYTSTICIV
jgi:hypothetical protein